MEVHGKRDVPSPLWVPEMSAERFSAGIVAAEAARAMVARAKNLANMVKEWVFEGWWVRLLREERVKRRL